MTNKRVKEFKRNSRLIYGAIIRKSKQMGDGIE